MTNQAAANKKSLLISLDGLSAEQFQYLSTSFGFLTGTSVTKITGNILNSAHGLWGETLSGRHWWESGCVGYAFPQSGLNDLEISSESSCKFGNLLGTECPSFVVNVPLLEPRPFRQWLSDGSLNMSEVAPAALLEKEPFKSYRARPYTSPVYYLSKPLEGAMHCLDLEMRRLNCAEQLCRQGNWHIGILRLTVFDQLCHLLGSNYIQNEDLAVRPALISFIKDASKILESIIQFSKISQGATIAIFSTYSHLECKARINLNLLLSQLGFCNLKDKATVRHNQNLRNQSTLALSSNKNASALVSVTNEFIEESSTAASPVHGAIYINKKDRFRNGIVETTAVESTTNEIASKIAGLLGDAGIKNIRLEINSHSSRNSIAPDIMLAVDGIDFHNLYDAPAIDSFSHPKSCHVGDGFILDNHTISDVLSLHKLLKGNP